MEAGGHEPCPEPAPIDPSEFYRLGSMTRVPECECSVCVNDGVAVDQVRRRTFDDYDTILLTPDEPLSRHQYFLCWSHVYAFILKDRLRGKSLDSTFEIRH